MRLHSNSITSIKYTNVKWNFIIKKCLKYVLQNDSTPDEVAKANDREKFTKNLSMSLDIFLNRMRADQVRGKPIAMDMTVQTLFKQVSELHPKLLEMMHDAEERRTHWEQLADKVNMISDARTALNALRDEHKQEVRRRAEEAERQRQILLAQKLEMMRQKKRQYLETQRAATLARMAENQAQLQVQLNTIVTGHKSVQFSFGWIF